METTVIKIKGFLDNSKVMFGGVTLFNPKQEQFLNTGDENTPPSPVSALYIRSNYPNMDEGLEKVTLKAYNGMLTPTAYSASNFELTDTEIVDGITVRTYVAKLRGEKWDYKGNWYRERFIRFGGRDSDDYDKVPFRVDVIGDNITISLSNGQGYSNPLIIDAEQLKYSDIPLIGTYLEVNRNTGTIKTEWFKNNTALRYIVINGPYSNIEGTILDFVNSWDSLEEFNFSSRVGIKGSLKEFLTELSNKGARNKIVECHISSSGITNDVEVYYATDSEGKYVINGSTSGVDLHKTGKIYALFDNNGKCTCYPMTLNSKVLKENSVNSYVDILGEVMSNSRKNPEEVTNEEYTWANYNTWSRDLINGTLIN